MGGIVQMRPAYSGSDVQVAPTFLRTVGLPDDFDGAIGDVGTITDEYSDTPTIPLVEDDQSDISGWAQLYARASGLRGKTPSITIDFTGFRGGGSPPTDWTPAYRSVDDVSVPSDGRPRAWAKIGSVNSSPFDFASALSDSEIEVCIRPRWRYLDTKNAVEYLAGTSYAVELPSSVAASSLPTHVIAEQTTTNNRNSTPTTVLNQYAIGFDDVSSQPAGGEDKLNFIHIIGQHATEDGGRYGGWDLVFYYAEATGTDADWLRQHVRLFVYDGNPTGVFTGKERFDADDSGSNDPNRAWDDTNSPTIEEIKSAITADVSRVDLLFDWHNYGDWGLGGDAPSATVGGFSGSGTAFTNWITRIEAASSESFSLLGTTATAGTAATYGDSTLSAQLSMTIEFASAKGTGYPDQEAQYAFFTDNIGPALKAMVDNGELTLTSLSSTVSADTQLPYNIRERVAAETQFLYNVRELVTQNHQLLYSIAETVGSDTSLTYNIAELVSSDTQLLANIRGLVSSDTQLLYDIVSLSVVGNSLQLLYNIAENVGTDTVIPYHIRELVSADTSLPYNLRELAGSSVQILYDILQSGIVGSSVQLPYNIREHVSADHQLPFNILVAVSQDVELLYRILNTVSADTQLPYSIAELARADVELRYNILADTVIRQLKEDGGIRLLRILHENRLVQVEHENTLILMDQSIH